MLFVAVGSGLEGERVSAVSCSGRCSAIRMTYVCDVMAAGVLGVVWFVLWMVFASESPSQHGRINTAERQYIVDTLMTDAVTRHQVASPQTAMATSHSK